MTYRVPFVDPREHYRRYKSEIDGAILACLSQGDLIYRKQLKDFEEHLAAFVGTKYAVGLNSGYHALHFSLLAAGIGAGDEVITVAHTFVATVSAIIHCGATPVLVDVGVDHNMDMEALTRAITPKTKAVIAVHLNGRLCQMEPLMNVIRQHRLVLIEDACQSLGATYQGKMAGSFGIGCFSFYPFKILGGFGDGGAITTNDPKVARAASLLRYNGEDRETGEYHYHGYTALLDNVQAAVLDVKLKRFPDWVEHRRTMAALYRRELSTVKGIVLLPTESQEYRESMQNFVILAQRRDALREFMKDQGVETLISWLTPMWEHKKLQLGTLRLPYTAQICREVLSLPMSAETTDHHVRDTVDAIKKFYAA